MLDCYTSQTENNGELDQFMDDNLTQSISMTQSHEQSIHIGSEIQQLSYQLEQLMSDTILDDMSEMTENQGSSLTASKDLNTKNHLDEYKKLMLQIDNKKTRTAIESMFNFLSSDLELLQDENTSLKEFMQNIKGEIQQQRNDFEEVNMNLSDQTAQYRLVSANLEKMQDKLMKQEIDHALVTRAYEEEIQNLISKLEENEVSVNLVNGYQSRLMKPHHQDLNGQSCLDTMGQTMTQLSIFQHSEYQSQPHQPQLQENANNSQQAIFIQQNFTEESPEKTLQEERVSIVSGARGKYVESMVTPGFVLKGYTKDNNVSSSIITDETPDQISCFQDVFEHRQLNAAKNQASPTYEPHSNFQSPSIIQYQSEFDTSRRNLESTLPYTKRVFDERDPKTPKKPKTSRVPNLNMHKIQQPLIETMLNESFEFSPQKDNIQGAKRTISQNNRAAATSRETFGGVQPLNIRNLNDKENLINTNRHHKLLGMIQEEESIPFDVRSNHTAVDFRRTHDLQLQQPSLFRASQNQQQQEKYPCLNHYERISFEKPKGQRQGQFSFMESSGECPDQQVFDLKVQSQTCRKALEQEFGKKPKKPSEKFKQGARKMCKNCKVSEMALRFKAWKEHNDKLYRQSRKGYHKNAWSNIQMNIIEEEMCAIDSETFNQEFKWAIQQIKDADQRVSTYSRRDGQSQFDDVSYDGELSNLVHTPERIQT